MSKSGAAASTLPKCRYFEELRFLHEKTQNRESDTNISFDISSEQFDLSAHDYPQELSVGSKNSTESESESASSTKRKANAGLTSENKCKKSNSRSDFDTIMLKQLEEVSTVISNVTEEECEESLYCKSLVPILKDLPHKKKRLAKIRISQMLFDLEFVEQ